MADEKRRLIYELLVEAKGNEKTKDDLEGIGKQLGNLGGIAKGVTGIFAAGFALKGIGEALDDLTKFNQGMATLGVTGAAATEALHGVQDIAFKTGNSMQGVTEVYKEAVQLQGQLGRSAEDAGRTTEAFIRIANAEGKSAQAAAQSIQTLSFALESGVLPAKQFTMMLRDSPTFAKAAQDALGKTTAELVAMAKESDLGAESLTRVVIALEHIGENTEAVVTVNGVVDSLKTLATTIVQATAEGANFNAQLSGGQTGWQQFMDGVRGLFEFLGGAIAVVNNFLQEFYNFVEFIPRLIANMGDIGATWDQFQENFQTDLVDMGRGFMAMWDNSLGGLLDFREQMSEADREAIQLAKDVKAIRDAKDKDFAKGFSESFSKSFDAHKAAWEKIQKESPAQWREFYEKQAEERKKAEKKEMDDYIEMLEAKGRVAAAAAKRQAEMEKEIQKGLKDFAEKNEKDLEESISEMRTEHIEGLSRQYFEEIDVMAEGAYILQDAFADLFTGGIRNAREFFQVILRGLAQVFAQIAAQKLAQGVMDILAGAMGGGGGGGGWAKMAADIGYSAKGHAFAGGHRMAFAQGGVVSGPTVFPMANGVGLMGEAGPEAVMPLKRMSNGKLGVSGGMPNIQIINQTGVAARARVQNHGDRMAIVLEAAHLGASMAEERFNRSVRTGYGAAAQSVQATYGLRRKV